MRPEEIPRLLRTVGTLRPVQIAWRLKYILERRYGLLAPALTAAPEKFEVRDPGSLPEVPLFSHTGASGQEAVAMLEQGEILHLNHRLKIGRKKPYWRLGAQDQDRLWTVTLHYHRWAYELARAASDGGDSKEVAQNLLRDYLTSWIEDCDLEQPGARELAWNCYAIATRLEWWIRIALELGPDILGKHPDFEKALLESMWKQAEFLYTHPEKDLMANHYLRDAVGLAWAASFFKGERPGQWMKEAIAISGEQACEQVLSDGGHFERSPMYHLHVMEDIIKLAVLLDDPAARDAMKKTWARMAEYIRWVRHPDGGIPLFNDAGLNASATAAEMFEQGRLLGWDVEDTPPRGGRHFADSGMVVWRGDPWSLFFDIGQVGPDYQPGHAHADTLSIELSAFGKRLVVDPGVFSYDPDETRKYDRSTAAHNTVCLDGQDSSEVWHIFRVGRRARPQGLRVDIGQDGLVAEASHDGYRFLPGAPMHARVIELREDGPVKITDRVCGAGAREITSGFLIDPAWTASEQERGWTLEAEGRKVSINVKGPEGIKTWIETRPYHPEYGLEKMTSRLCLRLNAKLPARLDYIIEAVR